MAKRAAPNTPQNRADGVLAVNKPRGPTSFDIVRLVRKLTGVRKVGHAGTLDPMAAGLLLVCLGEGTKAVPWLMDAPKRYLATVTLGRTTDSYDAAGNTVAEGEVGKFDEVHLESLLDRFRGTFSQVPPAHSALKRGGKRLYALARAGREVNPIAREVVVYSLELVGLALPEIELEVCCGRGFYVRSLAHDLGLALGCGGHLAALCRTESAGLRLDQAITPDVLERGEVPWRERLIDVNQALGSLPAVNLSVEETLAVRHGRMIPGESAPRGCALRLLGPKGELVAVAERQEGGNDLKVLRGFN